MFVVMMDLMVKRTYAQEVSTSSAVAVYATLKEANDAVETLVGRHPNAADDIDARALALGTPFQRLGARPRDSWKIRTFSVLVVPFSPPTLPWYSSSHPDDDDDY